MKLEICVLHGEFVTLEPLLDQAKSDFRDLMNCDPDTWQILPMNGRGEAFDSYRTIR
jgi:N-acetyltransferase